MTAMFQRLLQATGWLCYAYAALAATKWLESGHMMSAILAITSLVLGRTLIFIAMGPRRNPF